MKTKKLVKNEKLAKLNSKRPLPKETVKSLEESNILDWTQNSNTIEGNTLTLRETKVILEDIKNIQNQLIMKKQLYIQIIIKR